MNTSSKACLVVAHPGHELRVYGWLSKAKPKVFVLTNGGGSQNKSRLFSTTKILDGLDCTAGSVYGKFPDTEIYQYILHKNHAPLLQVTSEIAKTISDESYELIAGDACEGYNPSHEVCRLIINAAVTAANKVRKTPIKNYDIVLVGLPNACPAELKEQAIWTTLDEELLKRKVAAAQNYPELVEEVNTAISKFGLEPFRTECLRPVALAVQHGILTDLPPQYEKFGEERVKAGTYKDVIRYKEHILSIKETLDAWAKK